MGFKSPQLHIMALTSKRWSEIVYDRFATNQPGPLCRGATASGGLKPRRASRRRGAVVSTASTSTGRESGGRPTVTRVAGDRRLGSRRGVVERVVRLCGIADLAAASDSGKEDAAGDQGEQPDGGDEGLDIAVEPDTQTMAGVPSRALLPKDGARIQGPTFEEWLASEDAAALTV
jgi:hypothetical protein